MQNRLIVAFLIAAAAALPASAQNSDSTSADTVRSSDIWQTSDSRTGLRITSGRAYNRVEGLPVLVGPWIRGSIGATSLRLDVLGIIRTADSFHWDEGNVGHSITLDARNADQAGRGWSANLSSFDVVDAVEPWQMGGAESGLASFFFHRDYRDYFGKHGAKASASLLMSAHSSITAELSDERWKSRSARQVFSIWDNGARWRANPKLDEGRFHIGVLRARLDSRNNPETPATGWDLLAEYELGTGRITDAGLISAFARSSAPRRVTYGRALVDARGYNRISPASQLNARLVLGGWTNGDPLPMERRLSVGGPGTLPGYDFRDATLPGTDFFQCNSGALPPPGVPAQCDRVALAQLEYRSELHGNFFDAINARPVRIRGIGFTVRPAAVAFVDAGRGWLVGPRATDLRYPSGGFPRPGTFRTDVGLGLDLGLIGIYAAKAVSAEKEPVNVSVRVSRRF